MKGLLLFPPQWIPVSPNLSVPLLAGQLKAKGHQIDTLDLNVQFYNSILNNSGIRKAYLNAQNILSQEKRDTAKYQAAQTFFRKYGNALPELADQVDDAVAVMKSRTDFYDYAKLFEAKHTISLALQLLSVPYAPNRIAMDNYFGRHDYSMDGIRELLKQPEELIFYPFLQNAASHILQKEYDYIGISVSDLSQLIPALLLASVLKVGCSAHISLGGNYLVQIRDTLLNIPDFFSYCDTVMYSNGEESICQLAEYIDGLRSLETVTNILYRGADGSVIRNPENHIVDMEHTAFPDFSGLDMSAYFSPEPVFPIQFSKGCYWKKCTFCDYSYSQKCYQRKSVSRIADELEYYTKAFDAHTFMITDEAIAPDYYNRIALEILRRDLKITFYSFARLEDGFTDEILHNLYKAGARLFMWGYECASERIMQMINKGICIEHREEILRRSAKAGIWNNGLFIIGYPTESKEEIDQTTSFIAEHRDILQSCTLANFNLLQNAAVAKHPEEYGISSIEKSGDLLKKLNDVTDGLSVRERICIRQAIHDSVISGENAHIWSAVYSDFDHLVLYLSHFTSTQIQKMPFDLRWACIYF